MPNAVSKFFNRIHLKQILWLIAPAFVAMPCLAEDFDLEQDYELMDGQVSPMNRIERLHLSLSSQVVGLAQDIDSYFSDAEITDSKNRTRVTLRQQTQLLKSGETVNKFKVRGKLHLPGTQERFNLFIDTSWNNSKDLTAEILNANTIEEEESQSTSFGIEWLKKSQWNIRSRAGIRARIPLEPYYKFKIYRDYNINELWQTTLQQSIRYYHERGWSEKSGWYWQRYISGTMRFRAVSEIEFQDRNNYYDLAQIFALHQDLNRRTTVQYSIGTINNTDAHQNALNHFISVDYRRRLIKKWFLVSITPQLTAPRELNYKIEPSLSIRLDLLLTQ